MEDSGGVHSPPESLSGSRIDQNGRRIQGGKRWCRHAESRASHQDLRWRRPRLEDVSFEVPDGRFLAVIGLSGSGKSTLLRCINRLIEPTEGRITWNGEDITTASQEDLRRIRRRIGMVFQHFNLVERSKVLTNVLSGRLGYTNPALSLINRYSKEDVERAYAQLDRVGLREKAKTPRR